MPRFSLGWKQLHRIDRRRAIRTIMLDVLIVGGIAAASIIIGTSKV